MNKEKAVFAGGCFWGLEYYMQKLPGILSTRPGFSGGHIDNPSYEEVCEKNTGHYEAVEILFDADQVSFEALARLFFEIHDPTQENGQGPDIGPQYRSAIFYMNNKQKETSQRLISLLLDNGICAVTELLPFRSFWSTEAYHKDYYDKKGSLPYCHGHIKRFK